MILPFKIEGYIYMAFLLICPYIYKCYNNKNILQTIKKNFRYIEK